MIRALAAAALLLMLGACGTPPESPGSRPARVLPPAPPPPPLPDKTVACPADVKQCADGSFASRSPAMDCAFNPCPGEVTNK